MFNEKVNKLFTIETVIMIKNYKKELLRENTKLFNILIFNIFYLFNETNLTIIRYNNLIIFIIEFIRVYSIIKKSFSFNYHNIKDKYFQSSLYS